jgi:hypothetical protein
MFRRITGGDGGVISEADEGLGHPVLRRAREALKERVARGRGKLERLLREDIGGDGVPNQLFVP